MTSFLKRIYRKINYSNHMEEIKAICKKAETQQIAINNFLKGHNPMEEKFCSFRENACESCGLMFWEKDENHRYVLANEEHCEQFFKLHYPDCKIVIGKTGREVIRILESQEALKSSFQEVCGHGDKIVKQSMEPIRLIEFGHVNGEKILIDVTRTPMIKGGAFIGSTGYAMDVTSKENDMRDLIKYYESTGKARRINRVTDTDIAVYLINN